MKIVTRYLMKEVYSAMLASVVVLLFIFLSNVLIRLMHSAAGGVLTGKAVKLLILTTSPAMHRLDTFVFSPVSDLHRWQSFLHRCFRSSWR